MENTETARQPASRILIVDDVQENLKLLKRILSGGGHAVNACNSGKAALRFMERVVPDLVLLDVKMPEMDGYETCERMRAMPLLRDVPVIFVSAMDGSLNKVRAFSSGGVDYVVKPIDEAEVLARVNTHLSLAGLRKHLERRVEERTAQLRGNQLLLQSIVDSSGALITVKDLDGRYLLVNRRFRELFAANGKDLLGCTDHDIFPAPVADELLRIDLETAGAGEVLEIEESLPHEDGPHTYVTYKSPLRGLDGKVYAVCSIASDITARVLEEEELRELNEILECRLVQRQLQPGVVPGLAGMQGGDEKERAQG